MVQIIWEFVIKEENRGNFELTFGPGGAWSRLFARCPCFRGITLLRDIENPWRYLVIELWDTEVQREQALTSQNALYAGLEATLDGWSQSRIKVGVFRIQAEATVRPFERTKRSRPGKTGQNRL